MLYAEDNREGIGGKFRGKNSIGRRIEK